ncbi:MAG: UDP-N-acetylmuramate dehydrogenase [Balneolaceae bacterium]
MDSDSSFLSTSKRLQKNIALTSYNTLGVEAIAPLFVEITDRDQLPELSENGFFDNTTPVILGGGSNVLFFGDPKNPVVKISIPGIEVVKENHNHVWVKAGGGVNWHHLVSWCVEKGFGGIENLALIPGTVGAAPIQNIGAYGTELDQVFRELEGYIIADQKFETFQKEECKFAYRDSIFKRELKGEVIVTSVTLKLDKKPHQIADSYYSLQQYFEDHQVTNPSINDVYNAVISIRKSKLPDPSLLSNAGSFFKNPVVNQETFRGLKSGYPDIPSYPMDDGEVKIPAGWLIEKAGWKGRRVGNVGTYENQALVIVNHGNATGREIYDHAMKIQSDVSKKFGIKLAPEVNVIE